MAHVTSRRSPTGIWLPIVGAYLVTLLFFPVPMLAIGMLVCAALMLVSIYVLWTQARGVHAPRRARLDELVPKVLLGVVVVGAVLSFVFPPTMAVIGFGASVFACAAWFALERTLQARAPR